MKTAASSTKICFFINLLLILISTIALAQVKGISPKDITRKLNVSSYLPPAITDITIDPESPSDDDDVTVSAKIVVMSKKQENYIKAAVLKYRLSASDDWQSVEMDDDDNIWTAEIPAQPAGSEVEYRIEARDSNGNIAAEASPEQMSPMPEDCADISKCSSDSVDWSPAFTLDETGAPHREITAAVDISQIGAARTPGGVALSMKCEGDVSPGTLTPIDANAYAFAFLVPKPDGKTLSLRPWFWAYADLAKSFGYPPAALVASTDKDIPAGQSGFRYSVDGKTLVVEISAERLGLEEINEVALIAGSVWVYGNDFQHINVKTGAITPGLHLYFRSHSYSVEQAGSD